MAQPLEPLAVVTTGGTIDKAYFDALSAYHVGDTVVAKLLSIAQVTHPYEVVELLRKDYFFREDIQHWCAQRHLSRLDLAFSRDQAQRVYVQHKLTERSEDIRAWIHEGAAIYVCGSLKGMAPAVDAALTHILGADIVEELAAAGRYRRDVY